MSSYIRPREAEKSRANTLAVTTTTMTWGTFGDKEGYGGSNGKSEIISLAANPEPANHVAGESLPVMQPASPHVLYEAIMNKRWRAANDLLSENVDGEGGGCMGCGIGEPASTSSSAALLSRTWVYKLDGIDQYESRQTPLHAAARYGSPPWLLEELLRNHPLASRLVDERGNLPLHLAFAEGQSEDMIGVLLGAYPEAAHVRNGDGILPLDCAAESLRPNRAMIAFLRIEEKKMRVANERAIAEAVRRAEDKIRSEFDARMTQTQIEHKKDIVEAEMAVEEQCKIRLNEALERLRIENEESAEVREGEFNRQVQVLEVTAGELKSALITLMEDRSTDTDSRSMMAKAPSVSRSMATNSENLSINSIITGSTEYHHQVFDEDGNLIDRANLSSPRKHIKKQRSVMGKLKKFLSNKQDLKAIEESSKFLPTESEKESEWYDRDSSEEETRKEEENGEMAEQRQDVSVSAE